VALPCVEIWTDGACSGNPGPGGWAALLRCRGVERELSGGDADTTNNRMELLAVINGLGRLTVRSRVSIHIDSAYVMNAFEQNWIEGWIRRGWKNSKRLPVPNRDLWEQLIPLVAEHEVSWIKVKGHSEVEFNDRVDDLAVAAIKAHR
jgi:ribonuclease HI